MPATTTNPPMQPTASVRLEFKRQVERLRATYVPAPPLRPPHDLGRADNFAAFLAYIRGLTDASLSGDLPWPASSLPFAVAVALAMITPEALWEGVDNQHQLEQAIDAISSWLGTSASGKLPESPAAIAAAKLPYPLHVVEPERHALEIALIWLHGVGRSVNWGLAGWDGCPAEARALLGGYVMTTVQTVVDWLFQGRGQGGPRVPLCAGCVDAGAVAGLTKEVLDYLVHWDVGPCPCCREAAAKLAARQRKGASVVAVEELDHKGADSESRRVKNCLGRHRLSSFVGELGKVSLGHFLQAAVRQTYGSVQAGGLTSGMLWPALQGYLKRAGIDLQYAAVAFRLCPVCERERLDRNQNLPEREQAGQHRSYILTACFRCGYQFTARDKIGAESRAINVAPGGGFKPKESWTCECGYIYPAARCLRSDQAHWAECVEHDRCPDPDCRQPHLQGRQGKLSTVYYWMR